MRRIVGKLLRGGRAVPGIERAADWYDQAYTESAEYKAPYYDSRYYPVWAVIVDRVRRAQPERILELGCGSGQLASYLIEQDAMRGGYTGADFSPRAIEIARRLAPSGTFVIGDVLDPRTYDHQCDLIVCTEVLEHISDDLRVISLFPSGTRCLCTVPDFPYLSHVRFFASVEAVIERYGSSFVDLDVAVFKAPGPRGNPLLRYFLMDGIRS